MVYYTNKYNKQNLFMIVFEKNRTYKKYLIYKKTCENMAFITCKERSLTLGTIFENKSSAVSVLINS